MAKRIIALLLTCLLVTPCLSAFAAGEEPKYLVAETFENYITNGKPENGKYTALEHRVIDEGNGNKAVLIRSNDENFIGVSFSFGAVQIPSKFVASMDIRRTGSRGTGKINVYSPNTGKSINMLTFAEDGSVYDPSGYHVAGLNSMGTRLTFVCDTDAGVYSVYVDDRAVCKNWYFQSGQTTKQLGSFNFSFAPSNGETELIIDNIYLYEGTKILHPKKASPTKTIFNNTVLPYIPEEEPENGEDVNPDAPEQVDNTKVFFVRTFEEPAMSHFFGMAVRPEEAGEVRMDADGREYLYTYFDTTGRLDFNPNSNLYSRESVATKRYVIAQLDITGKVFDAKNTQLFNIYNRSDSISSDFVTLKGNTLTASNGTVVGTLREGTWNNVAIAMDFIDHTYDVYFDYELVQADIPFLNNKLSKMENWYVQNVLGELIVDDICLYSGKVPKPMDHNSYPKVSYLDADNADISIIKTLEILNLNNGRFYYKGDIVPSDEPMFIEKNDTYYMNAAKVAEAYEVTYADDEGVLVNGITLSDTVTENGIVYAEYEELLKDALGRKTLYDERGMIIAYTGTLNTNAYGVVGDYGMWDIFDYTNYDRPSPEELIAIYQEKSAGVHPRLIYSQAEIDAVLAKVQTDETFAKKYQKLLEQADSKFGFVPTEYQGSAWARSSEFNYIVPLAKAYLLSGDAKYAEEAWKHVEYNITTWKSSWFNTDNLPHSHVENGVAIFYDWCYDWLTPERRTLLEDEMLRNGLPVADATYNSRVTNSQYHWVNSDLLNQMPVTNSGHILVAISLMDRDPEYAAEVLSMALRAMENYGASFYPSGAYPESTTYYVYGMQYYQRLMSSLLTTFGDDFGLLDIPDLDLTPYYLVHLSTMLGSNNYHDSEGGAVTAYMGGFSWLSHVLNDPGIEAIRKAFSEVTNDSGADMFYSDFSDSTGDIELPLDAKFDQIEIASMRSGFASTQDTWLSFHGGAALPAHGHLDTGVYVLEMLGERFVYDLGSEDYGLLTELSQVTHELDDEMDKYGINSVNPWIYRNNTEGHNCIVINPDYDPAQNPNAFAPITRFESKPRGAIGVLDMSETYSFDARKAIRGYMMGDDRRSVTVRDEITVLKPDSEVWSFIYTKADVEIVDNTSAIFTMNGKKVLVQFLTDGTDAVLEAGEAVPFPQSPQYVKRSNEDFTKVMFHAKTDGDIFIQTKYIPLTDPNVDIPLENIPIAYWTIPDGEVQTLPELQGIRYNGELKEPFNAEQTTQVYKLPAGSSVPTVEAVYDTSLYTCETVQAESLQDSATITLRYISDPSVFITYTISFIELTQQPDYQGYELLQVYDVDSSYEENDTSGFKSNLVDGDLETKFATQFAEGTYIWMDLGSPQRIEALAMGVGYGDTRTNTFELQMSDDMKDWSRVEIITTTPTLDMVIYPLTAPVTARYIRLVPITCSNSSFFNTSEFYAARLR